jgi:type III pantothenate kinase
MVKLNLISAEKSVSEKASLLIDIGNSGIKYGLLENGSISEITSVSHAAIDSLPINQVDKIWFANVGPKKLTESLSSLNDYQQKLVTEVVTTPKAFGLHCGYQHFQNLGVDRWLAILAIAESATTPFAVIDAGTALTCDFVDGDKHLGGWIAPGFDMMRNALQHGTEQVFTHHQYPNALTLGTDTPECVNHGCMMFIQGCLEQAHKQLSQLGSSYTIYVTGGSAPLFYNCESATNIVFEKNLVLKGLRRFALPTF